MVRKISSLPSIFLQKGMKEQLKNYLSGLDLKNRLKARLLMEYGQMFGVDLKQQDYIDVCGEVVELWK